jgi:antitoxin (DNA-binding transcriptional repressor) of toxin-antitoxin stability system
VKTLTATEASRGFKAMLDTVAAGQTVRIVRDGQPVADVVPPQIRTGAALSQALEKFPPDQEWADITEQVRHRANAAPQADPWAEG